MTSVWVVESGEYSDYSVDGIFSTKEKAEDYAHKQNLIYQHNGANYPLHTVDERELDPVSEIPELKYVVDVSGTFGNPIFYPQEEPTYRIINSIISYGYSFSYRDRVVGYNGKVLQGEITGKTPELAMKNAQDKVAAFKAKYLEEN